MVRTLLKPLSFVPALLLMYMIYSFSAQPGEVSSQLSYKVSYKIVETVDQALNADMADWEIDTWVYRIHGLVRKLAHMAEYFALAVAVSFPLYVYGVHGIWLMLLAGFICVGFACGDEYHQSFVEGRGPSVRDVAIDSFGVFWGIILVRIVGWTGRKTIFRPRKKKKKSAKPQAQVRQEQMRYEPQMQTRQEQMRYEPQAQVRQEQMHYEPQMQARQEQMHYEPQMLEQMQAEQMQTRYEPQMQTQRRYTEPLQEDIQETQTWQHSESTVPMPHRAQAAQKWQQQKEAPQNDVVRRPHPSPYRQPMQEAQDETSYQPYTQSYYRAEMPHTPSSDEK